MGVFSKIVSKLRGTSTATELDWDELQTDLISADLGPRLSLLLIEEAKKIKGEDALGSLREILSNHLSKKSRSINRADGTTAIMVVGVNGTGKTTSVARLAHLFKSENSSVVLAAADTFRAAAIEQLSTWADRVGVEVVVGGAKADPASVAFDGAKRSVELQSDYLIIDTAGRLHNKSDLMDELTKIRRVVEKSVPLSEVLLVIDATTGQNGIAQAKIFSQAVAVTGLIVTKLDGSARGGVALAIEDELDIPIKFVGLGESEKDFAPFVTDMYIDGLIN